MEASPARAVTGVALLVLSAGGRVVSAGRVAERLFGHAGRRVDGEPFDALFAQPGMVRGALQRCTADGTGTTVCFNADAVGAGAQPIPCYVVVDSPPRSAGRPERLVATVRELRKVRCVCSPHSPPAQLLVPASSALLKLTPRQRLVLKLIASGHSTRDIAGQLGRSVKTIETHRSEIMKRLEISHVAGLVAFAIRTGQVAIE